MFKLLGRSTSGNVQKVMWLLDEIGAEYVREDYGREFGNTDGAYLALNPTGKVPTLVDGDVVVWESNTILRYVCEATNSTYLPAAAAERSAMGTWMDFQLASLNEPYLAVFRETRKPEEERGPELIDMAEALAGQLGIPNEKLEGRDWLVADALSLAEFSLAPIIHRCLNFPIELPELGNLRAWHNRLLTREKFANVVSPPKSAAV